MRMLVGTFIAVSGLIRQTNCINVPYSDIYLPVATNGFVCRTDFFAIDHLREAVGKAMEATFFKIYHQNFPRLFEDTHIFNVKSDILLSWPIISTGKFYHRRPGKVRVVMNIRGQIMGMVLLISELPNLKTGFEKCNPVRRYLEEDDEEQIFLNQNWSITRPTFGYNCGLKVISRSTVDGLMELASSNYFWKRMKDGDRPHHFEKYKGDKFQGNDLYTFPVHLGLTNRVTYGAPGPFRIVFDVRNCEFKGIINIEERREKCVTVWDLSSSSSDTNYNPSSVFDLETVHESYWPDTCFGHKFKTKTIWLYLEFALKDWTSKLNGRKLNFPYLLSGFIHLWPMRTPESHDNLPYHAFAIGHNTKLATYGLYRLRVRKGIFDNPELCLKFSRDHILYIKGILGQATPQI